MTAEARRWRVRLLAACAVALVGWFLASFYCTPLMPWCGDTGFAFSPGSNYQIPITSVEPHGAAAAAGMRAGDVIDLRDLTASERLLLRETPEAFAGRHVHYIVRRNGVPRSINIVAKQSVSWGGEAAVNYGGGTEFITFLSSFALLLCIFFAIVLSVRKADIPAARYLVFILLAPQIALGGVQLPSPVADFIVQTLQGIAASSAPILLFALFAACYAQPLSRARRVLTAIAVTFASAGALVFVLWMTSTAWLVPVDWSQWAQTPLWISMGYLNGFAGVAAIACGVAAARATVGAERQRVGWATASIAVSWVLIAFTDIVYPLVPPAWQSVAWWYVEQQVSLLVIPIGFLYAMLTRRFTDFGFVVNRAAVFGSISLIVVSIFVLIEWGLSEWVGSVSHATGIVVNAAAALCIGLSMSFIHRRVDRTIDAIFFRKRHESEMALRRFAREAAYITQPNVVLERAVRLVESCTETNAVYVLLENDMAGYSNVCGASGTDTVDANDPALVALRTWHEPAELNRYHTAISGEVAFPMIVRSRLIGALVCGSKAPGEAYAPDEFDALAQLAHGLGTALDALGHRHLDEMQEILLELQSLPQRIADAIDARKASLS